MKNKFFIISIFMLMLLIVFSGCLDEKSKFIGTWKTADGDTTMTFKDDNTVQIIGTGPIGIVSLVGTFDYAIANQKITFSSEGVGITLNYSFPNSTTLILSNDQGASILFTKT